MGWIFLNAGCLVVSFASGLGTSGAWEVVALLGVGCNAFALGANLERRFG